MRTTLLLMLFLSVCCSAQNSFIVKNDSLIWENVIISNETNIPDFIARHSRLKIISTSGKIYKGTGSGIKNTCPGASAFMEAEFCFDFELEMSDGKYRVTVGNLRFNEAAKGKNKNQGLISAEKFLIEKKQMKSSQQAQKDFDCLDAWLNRTFSNTAIFKNKS